MPKSTISERKGCGGVEHGSGGTIESPNFPNAFPEHIDCMWVIRYVQLLFLQVYSYALM